MKRTPWPSARRRTELHPSHAPCASCDHPFPTALAQSWRLDRAV